MNTINIFNKLEKWTKIANYRAEKQYKKLDILKNENLNFYTKECIKNDMKKQVIKDMVKAMKDYSFTIGEHKFHVTEQNNKFMFISNVVTDSLSGFKHRVQITLEKGEKMLIYFECQSINNENNTSKSFTSVDKYTFYRQYKESRDRENKNLIDEIKNIKDLEEFDKLSTYNKHMYAYYILFEFLFVITIDNANCNYYYDLKERLNL